GIVQPARQLCGRGRAVHVAGIAPADVRTDHPAGIDASGPGPARCNPGHHLLHLRAVQPGDATRLFDRLADLAVRADQERTEIGAAPVDADDVAVHVLPHRRVTPAPPSRGNTPP